MESEEQIQRSKEIASYLISIGNGTINNLRLQYLMYLVWNAYYKKYKKILFRDCFYAYKFGPCIPDLYFDYCAYGGHFISFDKNKAKLNRTIAKFIFEYYKQINVLTTYELTQVICASDGVWSSIFQNGDGLYSIIPFEIIAENSNTNV